MNKNLFGITNNYTQLTFTCSKWTTETLEKGDKCAQSSQWKHQNNIHVIMMSLLLTLNRFPTLFWCFHCWLWTKKCLWDHLFPRTSAVHSLDHDSNSVQARSCLTWYNPVLLFDTPWKHHKTFRFSVFSGYIKVTKGCDELKLTTNLSWLNTAS